MSRHRRHPFKEQARHTEPFRRAPLQMSAAHGGTASLLQQSANASPTVQRVLALKRLAHSRHGHNETRSRAVDPLAADPTIQRRADTSPAAGGGLGTALQGGIEHLSGLSMDHVTVHRNSAKPAEVGALAFAQGADIHLGPGQDRHLPHEAWHVVQQAQGRVKPTARLGAVAINNDRALEAEADAMGAQAAQFMRSGERNETHTPVRWHVGTSAVQRLVGAGAQPGSDHILPGVAADRGAAALKIAQFINRLAREVPNPAGGVMHEKTSVIGAHNAGNIYVRSDYQALAGAAVLETWSEMTGVGGGYVKRVRITENGVLVMDRVMNDAPGTALNIALAADAGGGGVHQYPPVHGVQGGDAAALTITGADEHSADNITKVVGEGARFGWLAQKLSSNQIGNTSTGIFNVTIKMPQAGTLTMDPTFQQLWGAWNSGFGRAYLKDKSAAKSLLQARMRERLRPAQDNEAAGAGPLANGAQAGGVITSLLTAGGDVILVPINLGGVAGTTILTDFAMTWTADH